MANSKHAKILDVPMLGDVSQSNFDNLAKELQILRDEIKIAQTQIQRLEEDKAAVLETLKRENANIERLKIESKEHENKIIQINDFKKEIEGLNEVKDQLKSNIRSNHIAIEDQKVILKENEEKNSNLVIDNQKLEKSIENMTGEILKFKEAIKIEEKTIDSLKEKQEEQGKSMEFENQKFIQEKNIKVKELKDIMESEKDKLEQCKDVLNADIAKLELDKSELIDVVYRKKIDLEELDKRFCQSKEELRLIDENLKAIMVRKSEFEKQIEELFEQEKLIKKQIDSAELDLQDRYDSLELRENILNSEILLYKEKEKDLQVYARRVKSVYAKTFPELKFNI